MAKTGFLMMRLTWNCLQKFQLHSLMSEVYTFCQSKKSQLNIIDNGFEAEVLKKMQAYYKVTFIHEIHFILLYTVHNFLNNNIHTQYMGRVKRICVFEHSVVTNFNCACPAIQRGQGSGFLSEGSSWLTVCMSEQRRFWRDCADAQARLNLRCSHRR